MPFGATPSRWCVCQFHHFRTLILDAGASRVEAETSRQHKYNKDNPDPVCWKWIALVPVGSSPRSLERPLPQANPMLPSIA